ncbi:MAG: tRNA (adenosine(37)-N6)-threonylcarbamoyltransferase complex transferase subunit TsaD [Candidatus Brockarchaeota archaeon]|nr:tRNA (adenosine(37)-N6)-threonylcarbamoyltransferase complex transferase subunit TsaD [Candidatus Brockarchaeota archaeon]
MGERLTCIGIESTAHTFGIGIVKYHPFQILCDVRRVYRPVSGGIHPSEAARHHIEKAVEALEEAMSRVDLKQVDIVAFARGPGLGPCLRVGAALARMLSLKLEKPLVGVNHAASHINIARALTRAIDPVVLYVSGGNTQVIYASEGKYVILGETEDIAVGNLIDVFARKAGLGFPGGPKVMELASKSRRLLKLPYSVKGMNVSFSGMLTMLEGLVGKEPVEDLCFSLQETAFSMLIEVSERAMAMLGVKEFIIAGGVGANARLRQMAGKMCEERNAVFKDYPIEYYADNGVMIAWEGIIQYMLGEKLNVEDSMVKPRWRIVDVKPPPSGLYEN